MPSRWLCHCGASARPSRPASALAHRVCAVAELVERACRAAELHDEQTRRLLGQPVAVPFERPPPCARCGPRHGSGSPAACASTPSAALPPKRSSSAAKRSMSSDNRWSKRATIGFSRSASAVSTTSWLVAPKWTCAACGSATAARSCRTSSGTTTPSRATPSLSLSRSGENESSAATIACAVGSPMMPSAASASANARSKSSIAASSRLQRKMARRFGVAEQSGQQGVIEGRNGHLSVDQLSKKTVSFSPWRWMSNV